MTECEAAGRAGSDPPQLVYDDDCGFCTWCAEFAAERGRFELVGFSELSAAQRARLPPEYERCAHLLTGDRVYSCGEAIEETLARVETPSRLLALAFRRLPGSDRVREPLYRGVAERRGLFGRIVGRQPPAGNDRDRVR